MKVALGTFACNGIKACLDADLATGIRAALNDFTGRIDAGRPPVAIPSLPQDAAPSDARCAVDLAVDDHTWAILKREAARQGATVAQVAAHSVLVYLAELDRLTPPDGVAETA